MQIRTYVRLDTSTRYMPATNYTLSVCQSVCLSTSSCRLISFFCNLFKSAFSAALKMSPILLPLLSILGTMQLPQASYKSSFCSETSCCLEGRACMYACMHACHEDQVYCRPVTLLTLSQQQSIQSLLLRINSLACQVRRAQQR